MPITFSLTYADFSRFQKVVAKRFRRKAGLLSLQFLLRVFVWACIGFAVAGYARLMRDFPDAAEPMKVVAASLALAVAVALGAPHWSQVLFRRQMLDPRGAFLSPQTVEISPSGLSVVSATGSTVVPWSGFLALDQDDENHYLFVDAMQAIVLPRKAIAKVQAEFEQHTRHLKSAA